jgi:hypothetical protein
MRFDLEGGRGERLGQVGPIVPAPSKGARGLRKSGDLAYATIPTAQRSERTNNINACQLAKLLCHNHVFLAWEEALVASTPGCVAGLELGWLCQRSGIIAASAQGQPLQPWLQLAAVLATAYQHFESLPIRHSLQCKSSPMRRRALRKPNNGGLFQPDLLTRFAVSGAVLLSLRSVLSKAVDCGF